MISMTAIRSPIKRSEGARSTPRPDARDSEVRLIARIAKRQTKAPKPHGVRLHVRKRRIYFNRFRRGDVVRYCSKIRPDLLPASSDKYGVILSAGIWGAMVAFNDFPDEPVFVGAKELKYATGIRVARTHSEAKTAQIKRRREISTEWD
jgi:hypothetical protein